MDMDSQVGFTPRRITRRKMVVFITQIAKSSALCECTINRMSQLIFSSKSNQSVNTDAIDPRSLLVAKLTPATTVIDPNWKPPSSRSKFKYKFNVLIP